MGRYVPNLNFEDELDLEEWLEEIASAVASVAQGLCPVLTGNLRRSITWEVKRDGGKVVAIIRAEANYAIYVELGTGRMDPRPFLRPALVQVAGSRAA